MTEPVVAYSVKEVLTRIERNITEMREDIHKLQLGQAAQQAVSRSRAALWTSGIAAVAAIAALIGAFTH